MRLASRTRQDLRVTHYPPLFAKQKGDASSVARLRGLSLLLFATSLFIAACGNADSTGSLDPSTYEIVTKATATPWPTATPAPVVAAREPISERQIHILSDAETYSTSDFEALLDFKLNKTYDVEGLVGADTAIYGFFGPDPYDRREYEARLYPDHYAPSL